MAMEFISEIQNIDGQAFVSLEDLKVNGVDFDKIKLMFNCYKINGYKVLSILVTFSPPLTECTIDEFRDLQKEALRRYAGMDEAFFWYKMGRLHRVDSYTYLETLADSNIMYSILYGPLGVNHFTKDLGSDISFLPFPVRLNTINSISENEVFFRLSDVEGLHLLPDQKERQSVQPDENDVPATCECYTIREIDLKTCMLTYRDVQSQVSGKGVFIIRQLLLTPHRDFPVSTLLAPVTGVNNGISDDTEIEKYTDTILMNKKEKFAYQEGVTELLEDIEDLEARLNDADEIEKKDAIEKELIMKNNQLKVVKKVLSESNGYIDENGIVSFRGILNGSGRSYLSKQRKNYKNQNDGTRGLLKYTINKIKDPALRDHLTSSITYGSKLRYAPTEQIEWDTV